METRNKQRFSLLLGNADPGRKLCETRDGPICIGENSAEEAGMNRLIIGKDRFDVKLLLEWYSSHLVPFLFAKALIYKNFAIRFNEKR